MGLLDAAGPEPAWAAVVPLPEALPPQVLWVADRMFATTIPASTTGAQPVASAGRYPIRVTIMDTDNTGQVRLGLSATGAQNSPLPIVAGQYKMTLTLAPGKTLYGVSIIAATVSVGVLIERQIVVGGR